MCQEKKKGVFTEVKALCICARCFHSAGNVQEAIAANPTKTKQKNLWSRAGEERKACLCRTSSPSAMLFFKDQLSDIPKLFTPRSPCESDLTKHTPVFLNRIEDAHSNLMVSSDKRPL